MTLRDTPNIISICRILLVVPVVYFLLESEYGLALLLFFVAGVSDGLDGYLAKRNNWTSRLGSILDPLADKLLLVSSFISLGASHVLPLWLVICVLARDLIIVTGGVSYHILIGEYDMEPSFISKANTFFQIVLVLAVVFSLGLFTLPQQLIDSLIVAVMVTTCASGVDYVWVWGRKALASHNNKN